MQVKTKSHESHSFSVNAASVLSIEKALILREIYRTCQYRAKNNLFHFGLPFCYYSAKGLADQFPYMNPKSINRWMMELESDGYVFSMVSNKMKIDRTKSYLVNFEMYDKLTEGECIDESHVIEWRESISQKLTMMAQNEKSISQNEKSISQNEPAITPSVIPLSENNPQPLSGESEASLEGKHAVSGDTPPIPPPPPSWQKVLSTRGKFELPATLTPNHSGNDWERRFFVFETFRAKYPGAKGGGIRELNNLIKSCKNSKSDIDVVLGKMLYAVLYQLKCKEHKDAAEEFFPHWKNLSTWLNQSCWEDEMSEWKGKAAWFNTMCPDSAKTEIERLKSILPCK